MQIFFSAVTVSVIKYKKPLHKILWEKLEPFSRHRVEHTPTEPWNIPKWFPAEKTIFVNWDSLYARLDSQFQVATIPTILSSNKEDQLRHNNSIPYMPVW